MSAPVDCDEYARWMRQAVHTLSSISADMGYGSYDWACFKAQQAAKLALKALLRAVGRPAFGHNLVQLYRDAQELCGRSSDELTLCVGYLDKLYVPPRYPDAFPEGSPFERFTRQEAEMALRCAEAVVNWVSGCSPCR